MILLKGGREELRGDQTQLPNQRREREKKVEVEKVWKEGIRIIIRILLRLST